MQKEVSRLKSAVREILGELPSQMFLCRIDKTLDEGLYDRQTLHKSCAKVENMVKLFIGVDEAKEIRRQYSDILAG